MNKPTVSIILPIYNRAAFLPEAIASIRAQTFNDWELIIVDDGSTDDSRELVPRLTADFSRPVRYLYQENQGAYGARNTGLDHAGGKYIAFYDSDDQWLPHHLERCVLALCANSEIDWVYGACRIVEAPSGREVAPSTFYVKGNPRPFLSLRTRSRAGGLRLIDDRRTIRCMVKHGLFCGLQNSLVRRSLFEAARFEAACRNEAEDQLIVIRALAAGRRFAYYDDVHVVYRIHDFNSSAAALGASAARREKIVRLMIDGYERLLRSTPLSILERAAVRQRIANEYFWGLGYAILWSHNQRAEALAAYKKGIYFYPLSLSFWKTFALASITRTVRCEV